ncbi:DUF3014 domain-containing protein [Psychromonas sp. RZ22]|uniref:DUF3014 domain-containing protein n=1 Tax=Psychromonas algarum TaxID=2555643 RepID=UPI0010685109|nr:DUF3014 domain-containing protein [Psychromonas sp. RZ22]TEW55325.1 DUF3014 domain-containing protein [Psychromonas sp. RZ22]
MVQEHKDHSSWVSIILLLICIGVLGYSVYYFVYSNSNRSVIALMEPIENMSKDVNELSSIVLEEDSDLVPIEVPSSALPIKAEVPKAQEVDDSLPLLDESDPIILTTLTEVSEPGLVAEKLLKHDLLRSSVVFIANFSNGEFISNFSPLTAINQPFIIESRNQEIFVDPRSYERYDNYTNYIVSIDSHKIVEHYKKLKPLIDEAYAEIARPGANFDDALNGAIEMVLSVPIVTEPIKLNSPSVMYRYSSLELENLNDAQKLMLRMGPDNLMKIQNKLQSLQTELDKMHH